MTSANRSTSSSIAASGDEAVSRERSLAPRVEGDFAGRAVFSSLALKRPFRWD